MTGPWQADTGDGGYRNPVLHADWSDPDVVRVGADYYLTASSFNRVPGLPILHSTDLVNWRILGHALDGLVPEEHYATPRHGCGVWAPSIRYHAGRFWICYPDPDHGLFVVTAEDPAGPWTPPRLMLAGPGRIDPCPLWDDDGRAYLVHAWARSRCGFNNRLTAYRMSPDLEHVLDEGTVVVDGDAIPGCRTLEGPKWYRRDGWYWILAPAGGVRDGWQYALRSRDVLGPYQHRTVLAQGASDVNGPHQGALVDTPTGEDWFAHFSDRGAYGRITYLQPVRWRADGWPVVGTDDGSGCGTPVAAHRKPVTTGSGDGAAAAVHTPATSDDFADGRFGPQWTWQANPQPVWRPGPGAPAAGSPPGDGVGEPVGHGLRLASHRGSFADLRTAPNVLGQRLPGPAFRAETGLRLDTSVPGARAGLVVLGSTYAWIGLERDGSGALLVCRAAEPDDGAEPRGVEPVGVASGGRPTPQTPLVERATSTPVRLAANAHVRLAVTVDERAVARFAADVDGTGWREIGAPFTATPGLWIGATLGLFAVAPADPAGPAGAGTATFDPFTVTGPVPTAADPATHPH